MKRNQWGKNNPNWKGGRFHSTNGYIWLYMPDHPNSSKVSPVGYVLEHRYVVEQKLLRYLKKEEVVHHINGIRDDNRIENLVVTNASAHIGDHNKERIHTQESKEKHSIIAKTNMRNKNGQFIKRSERT